MNKAIIGKKIRKEHFADSLSNTIGFRDLLLSVLVTKLGKKVIAHKFVSLRVPLYFWLCAKLRVTEKLNEKLFCCSGY